MVWPLPQIAMQHAPIAAKPSPYRSSLQWLPVITTIHVPTTAVSHHGTATSRQPTPTDIVCCYPAPLSTNGSSISHGAATPPKPPSMVVACGQHPQAPTVAGPHHGTAISIQPPPIVVACGRHQTITNGSSTSPRHGHLKPSHHPWL